MDDQFSNGVFIKMTPTPQAILNLHVDGECRTSPEVKCGICEPDEG